MNKFFKVILLCYTIFIVSSLIDFGEANHTEVFYRPKRFLSFNNITHFFLRVNFKANMVPWNQIFAQAIGFRINWDDPPNSFHPHHRLYRKDIYTHMETVLERSGLNGFHCVRRAICEIGMVHEPTEIYHNILKMVFRQQSSATSRWHNRTERNCHESISSCPFSLLKVSRYTDII